MLIRHLKSGEGNRAAELTGACPGAAQWSAQDYERMAADTTEEPPGEIAGLLAARTVAQEAELLNVAVAPDKRRRGLAAALLAEALRRLAAAGAQKVWLEVRESNHAAIAFYQRHGFAILGRRRTYYQLPPEDALILGREVALLGRYKLLGGLCLCLPACWGGACPARRGAASNAPTSAGYGIGSRAASLEIQTETLPMGLPKSRPVWYNDRALEVSGAHL